MHTAFRRRFVVSLLILLLLGSTSLLALIPFDLRLWAFAPQVNASLSVSEDVSKFTVENDYFIAKIFKDTGGINEFYIKPEDTINIVTSNYYTFLGGHEMEWYNGSTSRGSAQWESIDSVSVTKVYESDSIVTIESALVWTTPPNPKFRVYEFMTFYADKPYYLVTFTRHWDEEMPIIKNGDVCFLFSTSRFWGCVDTANIIDKNGDVGVFGYREYRWLYESRTYGSLPWAWVYNITMNVGFGVILLDAYPHPQDVYLGERVYQPAGYYHEFQIRDFGLGGARREGDYQVVSYVGVVGNSTSCSYIQTLAEDLYLSNSETVPRISIPLMVNYGKTWAFVGRTMMPKFRGDCGDYGFIERIIMERAWDNAVYYQSFVPRYENSTSWYSIWDWADAEVSDYYWNGSYFRLAWRRQFESKFNTTVTFQFWNDSDTFQVDWQLKTLASSNITSIYLLWGSGTTEATFKSTTDTSYTKLNVSSVFNPHMQDEGYMIRNMTDNYRQLSGPISYWYWLHLPSNPVASGQTFHITHQIQYVRRYDYEGLGYFGVSDFHAPSEGESELERLNKHYWTPLPLFETQQDNLRILGISQQRVQVAHSSYDGSKLTLLIMGDSGKTSTTKVYCGSKGEPASVYGATWSYDDSAKMLTVMVHHEGPEEVVVRWSGAADSIDGQQYYLWGEEPTHGQPDHGTGYDVGSLRKARPSSWQRRNCSCWVQYFFDQEGTYDSETYNFNKLYFHLYWSSFEFGFLLGYRLAGVYGGLPDGSKNVTDNVGIYYTNASQSITTYSDFKLSVGLLGMNGSVVGNAIYNLTIYFLKMADYSPSYPMVLSPPHDPSFIIINPPNNATLQSMDTDSDGLSDYDEMFTYYTDPRYADTYGLGWKDDGSPLSSYAYPWQRFQAFFNDSLRTETLNFDGTQSQFVYARLFKYNYIQDASLSIASFPKPLECIRAPANASGDGWRIFGIAIGDVNNDGKNELLTDDMAGNVRVWNTTSWTIIFSFDAGAQASDFAIGDLLNDVGDEFVVGSYEGNVYVFNSTFQQKWTADIGSNAFAFTIADVDDDGANELVVGGIPFLLVYNSSFAVEQNITTCQPCGWGLAVGDANNDGLPDIAVASNYNYVNVYNSSGKYQLIKRFQALDNVFGWPRVHVSDIDNDGKSEIVVAGADGVSVWRLQGTDLASVWNSSYIGARPETLYPKMGSAVVDLDGDGKKEIIVSGHKPGYNGTVYIIDSLGKTIYRFNSPRQVCGIAVDDVDNDGDNDIVFGRESTNIITMYDGLPRNVMVDVGNDGSYEFSFAGLYTYNMTVDVKNALNSYLVSAPNYWVDVPIGITCTGGTLGLTVNIQYTTFSSQDLDDLNDNYKMSNIPYVQNITNGGITALSYLSGKTTFTVESSSGTTSITKLHSNCRGDPVSVTGATSWSYNPATNILTIIVTHSSAQIVEVHWPTLGDVNRDGSVNILDLHILSKAYDATPSNPNWNPNYDLNCDNIIDSLDLSILNGNYGKTLN